MTIREGLSVLALFVAGLAGAPASFAADTPPARLSGTLPAYPAIATRYNVQGSVVVRLTIDVDGHVLKTEVLRSSADVFSEAVTNATSDWLFTKPAAPTSTLMRVPFALTGSNTEYAFDVGVRPIESAPKSAADLPTNIIAGWCIAKVLVDSTGAPSGRLMLRASSPEFRATGEAILDALRYAKAPDDLHGLKMTTSNELTVTVSPDLKIEIKQNPGDVRSPDLPVAP